MQDPLVSVELLAFNQRRYIGQALDGILGQKTDFPIELVVGDDCSHDGTREVVARYRESHPDLVRMVTSEMNVGLRKNHYRTFKACRGKYVAFCDGDDYWHCPEKLQRQVEHMESEPACSLVCTDYDLLIERQEHRIAGVVESRGLAPVGTPTVEDFVQGKGVRFIQTSTVLARREQVERLMESDQHLHLDAPFPVSDIQLWAELSTLGTIRYVPRSMVTYRVLDESLSNFTSPAKRLRFERSCLDIKIYLAKKHKLSAVVTSSLEADWLDRSLLLAMEEGDGSLADEIRTMGARFTPKQRIRYLAAKYPVVRNGYRAAAYLQGIFRGRQSTSYWDQ